jgi:hypothetical protein
VRPEKDRKSFESYAAQVERDKNFCLRVKSSKESPFFETMKSPKKSPFCKEWSR